MRKYSFFVLILALLLSLSSCGAKEEETGYQVGDKISTDFFDYRVDSALSTGSYEGRRASQDRQLILVELTIENTEEYSLPMGRYDFQLRWGEGDGDVSSPLKQFCPAQLADEYDIAVDETVQGVLIFEVPDGRKEFSLGFLEVYEDNSEGESYFVYFTV